MTANDTVGRELATLAEDLVAGEAAPPDPGTVWHSGTRRRWKARGLAVGAVAVVAALGASLVLPLGSAPRALPAARPGAALPSYPEHVAMPFDPPVTRTPGVAALALPGLRGDRQVVYTVGPTGAVSVLDAGTRQDGPVSAPAPDAEDVALSPDGRWLADPTSLRDLVSGREIGVATDGSPTQVELSLQGTPWWSPDSRRVLLPGPSSGSLGLVVDVAAGTSTVVPPAGVGDVLELAGWRDPTTVVAVWRNGPDTRRLLFWSVGAAQWTDGATITWPVSSMDGARAATMSPDGTRVVLLEQASSDDAAAVPLTSAQVFDVATGAVVGFPVPGADAGANRWAEGSFVQWTGYGCRPVWRDGALVVTDRVAMSLANGTGEALVRISSSFESPCASVAGDHLQGRPAPNLTAVWAERSRTWGLPLAGLVLLGLVIWRRGRRQHWAQGREPLPSTFPVLGR